MDKVELNNLTLHFKNQKPYDEAETLRKLTALRSLAFSLAASGKHGDYPHDETFNDEVEKGFADDGSWWRSKDGTYIDFNSIS